ncbi:hypothetical protein [Mesorhizobium sp. M1406]|uniref:hypothetical protein n=1 Tax=Mesorhizobium sp. M1406 TaxID=2957099 RepID=UPI0033392D7B
MTDTPLPGPDMRDLMAAVGEVLLCWGYVEAAIRKRLSVISPADMKASKTPVLLRWRKVEPPTPELAELLKEIDRLAIVRNCLAHGLASASANPWEPEEPEVACRLGEMDKTVTLSELRETARSLHRVSHAIRSPI